MIEPVVLLGIPVDFILFALTLLGVALFHRHTLPVALTGLAAIIVYKLAFTGFKFGAGLGGLGQHMAHEWVMLTNLFLLLMGGIYLGLFSPSSAGAVGACGALLVVLGRRRLTGAAFLGSLRSTATITCILFAIIIGGLLFSRMLVSTGAINELIAAIPGGAKPAPWVVLTVTVIVYLILGCLVDSTSMIIVTLPFLFPMAQAAGLDPIWYGILVIQLVEISAITPPVGMNLFATVSAAQGQVTIEDVIRGISPFVVLSLVILGILIAFPQLALWLPNRMFNQ